MPAPIAASKTTNPRLHGCIAKQPMCQHAQTANTLPAGLIYTLFNSRIFVGSRVHARLVSDYAGAALVLPATQRFTRQNQPYVPVRPPTLPPAVATALVRHTPHGRATGSHLAAKGCLPRSTPDPSAALQLTVSAEHRPKRVVEHLTQPRLDPYT